MKIEHVSKNGIIVGLECGLYTDYVCSSLGSANIFYKKVVYENEYWIKIPADYFYAVIPEDKYHMSIVQNKQGLKIPKEMITSFVVMGV